MNKDQYQQLASQFIEMWQQQMQSVLTDKDFVQSMLSSLQHMAQFATPQAYDISNATKQSAPSGASSAPADLTQLLSQLDYRLRMVESRLNKLEGGQKGKGSVKRASTGSRKSGAKPVRKSTKGN